MKRTRRIILSMWVLLTFCLLGYAQQDSEKKIVVAYVTSWSKIMPDSKMMTHINYAFGHVINTFDGVRVDNPKRLKQIVALKKENPGSSAALLWVARVYPGLVSWVFICQPSP